MKMKEVDLKEITKALDVAARAAISEYIAASHCIQITSKVKYVNVNHTELSPEGNAFTIQIAVEIHEITTAQ